MGDGVISSTLRMVPAVIGVEVAVASGLVVLPAEGTVEVAASVSSCGRELGVGRVWTVGSLDSPAIVAVREEGAKVMVLV